MSDAGDGRGDGRPERRDPDDGVDVTLIRWMLSLTPGERLDTLQAAVNSLEELRRAVRQG